jgi:hypothetical protein
MASGTKIQNQWFALIRKDRGLVVDVVKEGQASRKYDDPKYPCVELQRDGYILLLTS